MNLGANLCPCLKRKFFVDNPTLLGIQSIGGEHRSIFSETLLLCTNERTFVLGPVSSYLAFHVHLEHSTLKMVFNRPFVADSHTRLRTG
jgi:hypothetical protein